MIMVDKARTHPPLEGLSSLLDLLLLLDAETAALAYYLQKYGRRPAWLTGARDADAIPWHLKTVKT